MTFYIQKGQTQLHCDIIMFSFFSITVEGCSFLITPHSWCFRPMLFFSRLFREAKLETHLISCNSWFTISLPLTAFCLYLYTIFFTSLKHKICFVVVLRSLFSFLFFAFSQFFLHDTQIKNAHQNGGRVGNAHSDALKCIDLGNTIQIHVNVKCVCL